MSNQQVTTLLKKRTAPVQEVVTKKAAVVSPQNIDDDNPAINQRDVGFDTDPDEVVDTVALFMFFTSSLDAEITPEYAFQFQQSAVASITTEKPKYRQMYDITVNHVSQLYKIEDETAIDEMIMKIVDSDELLIKSINMGHFQFPDNAFNLALRLKKLGSATPYLAIAVSRVMNAGTAERLEDYKGTLRQLQQTIGKSAKKMARLKANEEAFKAREAQLIQLGHEAIATKEARIEQVTQFGREEIAQREAVIQEQSVRLQAEMQQKEFAERTLQAVAANQQFAVAELNEKLEEKAEQLNNLLDQVDSAEARVRQSAATAQMSEQKAQEAESVALQTMAQLEQAQNTVSQLAVNAQQQAAQKSELINAVEQKDVEIATLKQQIEAVLTQQGQLSVQFDQGNSRLKSMLGTMESEKAGLLTNIESREKRIAELESAIGTEKDRVKSLLETHRPMTEIEALKAENLRLMAELEKSKQTLVAPAAPVVAPVAVPVSVPAAVTPVEQPKSVWDDESELQKAMAIAKAHWAKHPLAKKRDLELKNQKVVTTAAEYVPGKTDFPGVDLGSKIIKRKTKKS